MINVSDKSCKRNQNAHFVFNYFFFLNRAFMRQYRKIMKSRASYRRQYDMCIACWIAKATQTLTICNIYAFLLQQWLQELATLLLYR